jgi:hypothetical protein
MPQVTYTLNVAAINSHSTGWRVKVEGPILGNKGIHLKTNAATMRLRSIDVDNDSVEIRGLLHCNIERFTIFTDDPEMVRATDGSEWIQFRTVDP